MILVDANLLVYAYVTSYPQHERAGSWLADVLSGRTRVGLPWEALLAFARVVTSPRIHPRPAPMARAWGQIGAWLESPVAWVPQPTERHQEALGTLLALTNASADDIHDAHLAAIALQHGLTLCSADSDFARFPGLRWENPLAV
ncbi:MAG TPA: TA system VapC family ribonuclease toxin [Gaiellaceae bacterium]